MELHQGIPSDEQLKKLAKDLHISHFYVADNTGYFIRNTDIPPEQRINKLYDFCEDYRGLLTGKYTIQQTPILPSDPYTGPYKFTMIPNHDKTKILEVGYHMSYIADTLKRVVYSDKNIENIGFFSPNGFE